MEEHFGKIIAHVQQLHDECAPTTGDAAILHEIKEKLISLTDRFGELMKLNKMLSTLDPLAMTFSIVPGSNELVVQLGGKEQSRLRLKPTDPNRPITIAASGQVGAFTPGKRRDDEPDTLKTAERELGSLLEAYYRDAHHVQKQISNLSFGKKTKIGGAGLVRNWLVEHPPSGALYTFGWSDNGPCVKPMSRRDLKHRDNGLIPNTKEFLEEIYRCLT